MSKRLKCPECGANQGDIRYVCETVEYHYIDAVTDDGGVELGGIDDSYPSDNFWFNCSKCDHNFKLDGGPADLPQD